MLSRDEVLAEVAAEGVNPPPIVVACERLVADSLASLRPQSIAEPTAGDALPLALRRIEEGEFDDVALTDANYLRRTDLEIFAKQRAAGAATR
jgi:tRNA threonylcarbamoyladenosine biosynthesis protein TsaB